MGVTSAAKQVFDQAPESVQRWINEKWANEARFKTKSAATITARWLIELHEQDQAILPQPDGDDNMTTPIAEVRET